MLNFACLELTKNRKLFWGLAAAFTASLPIAAWSSARMQHGAAHGVDAALLFWAALGLPVAALFMGAHSGSAQSSVSGRAAEALLPLSPRQRLGGALAGSSLHAAALGVVVIGCAFLFSPGFRGGVSDAFLRSVIGLTGFSAAYCLLASLCLAYVAGHAIVGAAAAALLAVPLVGALSWGLGLEQLHGVRAPFSLTAWLSGAAALSGALAAVRMLAPWLERKERRGARGIFSVAACLAAGLCVVEAGSLWQRRALMSGQFLAQFDEQHVAGGALATTFSGEVVLITPEGRKRLLPPEPTAGVRRLFGHSRKLLSAVSGEDGKIYLLQRVFTLESGQPRLEVWRTGGSAPEKLFEGPGWGESMSLVLRGKKPGLMEHGRPARYAALPSAAGKPLKWTPFGVPAWTFGNRPLKSAADGSSWGWRENGWYIRTPEGSLLPPFSPPADASTYLHTDGRSVWLLAGRTLVRAKAEDGTVEEHWRLPDVSAMRGEKHFQGLAQGLLWHTGRRIWFVGWDGRRKDLGPPWKAAR